MATPNSQVPGVCENAGVHRTKRQTTVQTRIHTIVKGERGTKANANFGIRSLPYKGKELPLLEVRVQPVSSDAVVARISHVNNALEVGHAGGIAELKRTTPIASE